MRVSLVNIVERFESPTCLRQQEVINNHFLARTIVAADSELLLPLWILLWLRRRKAFRRVGFLTEYLLVSREQFRFRLDRPHAIGHRYWKLGQGGDAGLIAVDDGYLEFGPEPVK